jgi:hypothetical protein
MKSVSLILLIITTVLSTACADVSLPQYSSSNISTTGPTVSITRYTENVLPKQLYGSKDIREEHPIADNLFRQGEQPGSPENSFTDLKNFNRIKYWEGKGGDNTPPQPPAGALPERPITPEQQQKVSYLVNRFSEDKGSASGANPPSIPQRPAAQIPKVSTPQPGGGASPPPEQKQSVADLINKWTSKSDNAIKPPSTPQRPAAQVPKASTPQAGGASSPSEHQQRVADLVNKWARGKGGGGPSSKPGFPLPVPPDSTASKVVPVSQRAKDWETSKKGPVQQRPEPLKRPTDKLESGTPALPESIPQARPQPSEPVGPSQAPPASPTNSKMTQGRADNTGKYTNMTPEHKSLGDSRPFQPEVPSRPMDQPYSPKVGDLDGQPDGVDKPMPNKNPPAKLKPDTKTPEFGSPGLKTGQQKPPPNRAASKPKKFRDKSYSLEEMKWINPVKRKADQERRILEAKKKADAADAAKETGKTAEEVQQPNPKSPKQPATLVTGKNTKQVERPQAPSQLRPNSAPGPKNEAPSSPVPETAIPGGDSFPDVISVIHSPPAWSGAVATADTPSDSPLLSGESFEVLSTDLNHIKSWTERLMELRDVNYDTRPALEGSRPWEGFTDGNSRLVSPHNSRPHNVFRSKDVPKPLNVPRMQSDPKPEDLPKQDYAESQDLPMPLKDVPKSLDAPKHQEVPRPQDSPKQPSPQDPGTTTGSKFPKAGSQGKPQTRSKVEELAKKFGGVKNPRSKPQPPSKEPLPQDVGGTAALIDPGNGAGRSPTGSKVGELKSLFEENLLSQPQPLQPPSSGIVAHNPGGSSNLASRPEEWSRGGFVPKVEGVPEDLSPPTPLEAFPDFDHWTSTPPSFPDFTPPGSPIPEPQPPKPQLPPKLRPEQLDFKDKLKLWQSMCTDGQIKLPENKDYWSKIRTFSPKLVGACEEGMNEMMLEKFESPDIPKDPLPKENVTPEGSSPGSESTTPQIPEVKPKTQSPKNAKQPVNKADAKLLESLKGEMWRRRLEREEFFSKLDESSLSNGATPDPKPLPENWKPTVPDKSFDPFVDWNLKHGYFDTGIAMSKPLQKMKPKQSGQLGTEEFLEAQKQAKIEKQRFDVPTGDLSRAVQLLEILKKNAGDPSKAAATVEFVGDQLKEAGFTLPQATISQLRFLGHEVTPFMETQGIIAGFASMPYLAPAANFLMEPELLELGMLAANAEVLAAVGITVAAPELASIAMEAAPAVIGDAGRAAVAGSEAFLKVGMAGAQFAGMVGPEAFKVVGSVISIGTSVSSVVLKKLSTGWIAGISTISGAAVVGGVIGAVLGGLFAHHKAKDKSTGVQMATSSSVTIRTTLQENSITEFITETLKGGPTVSVKTTPASQKTSEPPSKLKKATTTKNPEGQKKKEKPSKSAKTISHPTASNQAKATKAPKPQKTKADPNRPAKSTSPKNTRNRPAKPSKPTATKASKQPKSHKLQPTTLVTSKTPAKTPLVPVPIPVTVPIPHHCKHTKTHSTIVTDATPTLKIDAIEDCRQHAPKTPWFIPYANTSSPSLNHTTAVQNVTLVKPYNISQPLVNWTNITFSRPEQENWDIFSNRTFYNGTTGEFLLGGGNLTLPSNVSKAVFWGNGTGNGTAFNVPL